MSTMIASHFFCFGNEADGGHHCVWERGQTEEFENCRSKEFRPNFPAEQNAGRIWPQPKCSKVGKVQQQQQSGQVSRGWGVLAGLSCCAVLCCAVQPHTVLQCKQRRCSSILQLAQKWLKQESNVFIAHTAAPRRFMEKKSTHSMINSCPEILTHNKSLALHGSIGQTPKMAKPPEIYPSQ